MKYWRVAIVFLISALALSIDAGAQFKEDAFSQQYNEKPGKGKKDTTDVLFSFPEFFGALGHKNTMKVGNMFAGSVVFIGSSQIYNKQYWKLPIVYGGIGAGLTAGICYNEQYKQSGDESFKLYSTLGFVGAGLFYWGSLLDGVICYKPSKYPHAGKATIYSILVPGLGQIYNKEYWKLPIYWGGMLASAHFYIENKVNYERFRRIYNELTDPSATYEGPSSITADTAKYYRDTYRRYRDYSILAFFGVYLLQIIDANVFSYMHDFNVSEDISLKVEPAVINVGDNYAFTPQTQGLGLKVGFTF